MRKTDKKIDNQLRAALTDVCETALKEFIGFRWLTHLVDYARFPKSIKVVCIFDTNDDLNAFMLKGANHELNTIIQKRFLALGITIPNIANHISYDSEENCDKQHDGRWADRLKLR